MKMYSSPIILPNPRNDYEAYLKELKALAAELKDKKV